MRCFQLVLPFFSPKNKNGFSQLELLLHDIQHLWKPLVGSFLWNIKSYLLYECICMLWYSILVQYCCVGIFLKKPSKRTGVGQSKGMYFQFWRIKRVHRKIPLKPNSTVCVERHSHLYVCLLPPARWAKLPPKCVVPSPASMKRRNTWSLVYFRRFAPYDLHSRYKYKIIKGIKRFSRHKDT